MSMQSGEESKEKAKKAIKDYPIERELEQDSVIDKLDTTSKTSY